MATIAELQDALVNADRAGDADAARKLADAIVQARAAPVQQRAPAEPMAFGERFRMGLADPFQGGAQLLTNALPESVVSAGNRLNNWLADKTGMVARLPEGGVQQQTMEREAAYQAARMAAAPHTLSSLITGEKSPEFDWARLLGNVASPANLAPGAAAVRATTLGGRMAAGAGVGAASSLLAPVAADGEDYWAEKAKQAAVGATVGGAVPGVVAGVSRVISPKASKNPALDLLKAEGVQPTVGQSVGGWGQRLEEKLQSWPIMGDAITAARTRSMEQLNKAAINRATAPIGVKIDDVGQDGIRKAGDALSDAYDSVLSGLKVVKFDPQWAQDFGQLKTLARGLPSGVRGTFLNKTKTLIEDRISVANGMTAQTMKQIDSELGTLARRYGRSSVASEQELGDALLQAQALLREQVGRNSPSAAARIKDINQGWANLVRVEGAGKAAINNDGVFTPAQLNQAIRTADSSVRKRSAARGTALMQDLGNAAQKQMGGRVANSGTVDRAAIGIGGLASYFIDPMIPIGLGLGAAAYSPPAQALLRGLTSARPAAAQPIASMLNKTAPMLSPASGLLALDLLE